MLCNSQGKTKVFRNCPNPENPSEEDGKMDINQEGGPPGEKISWKTPDLLRHDPNSGLKTTEFSWLEPGHKDFQKKSLYLGYIYSTFERKQPVFGEGGGENKGNSFPTPSP